MEKWERIKEARRQLRDEIFVFQQAKCFWCKKPMLNKQATLEHIVPLSKGGTDDRHNIVVACQACNWKKADNGYQEFLELLKEKDNA